MVPKKFPTLLKDDVLPPGSPDYFKDERATAVGWLRRLFLFNIDGDYLEISKQDEKDYRAACSKFMELNKIKKGTDLHDWEDDKKNTQKKQAVALNKLFRTYEKELNNE